MTKVFQKVFVDAPEKYRTQAARFTDAIELISIGIDFYGRDAFLHPLAAQAWIRVMTASKQDGIHLRLISAFRSIEHQKRIIQKKLEQGLTWDEILRFSAFPGFSEHHTGCAVDIASPNCPELITDFENTHEFRWLTSNAEKFGFRMSYPRGNDYGFEFEPWHWMWHPHEHPRR
jgi:D-alanyl-D-alanine carboxypeptidase